MKKLCLVLSMLLAGCFGHTTKTVSETLRVEVVDENTGAVFRAPAGWGVVPHEKGEGAYVASKGGHGFEWCQVGKMKISPDVASGEGDKEILSNIDKYFLNETIKKIEQKGKFKFIKAKEKRLDGIIMGGTHSISEGSGVAIYGKVENLERTGITPMTIYIAYSADVENRVGFECTMIGKDKNEKFLETVKAMVKTVTYKNEYYQ